MANIINVAKRAGVSISTVSYVLSGNRPVSEATKALVLKAMEEIGYRPHAHARALASRRSRILALLHPPTRRGLGDTEFSFISNASSVARELGYHLVLWTSEYDDEEGLRQFVRQGLVDGLILMEVHSHDGRVGLLRDMGFPFVLIGRCTDSDGAEAKDQGGVDAGWADIDFHATMYDAVSHLSSLGHRSIAFVNQSREVYVSEYGPAVRSHEAFFSAVSTLGFHGVHLFCEADSKEGHRAFAALLRNHPELTAVVAMNDRALPGIHRALAEAGLRVPLDFSVVTIVSSSRVSQMFYPALTAAEVPGQDLARIAVEHLIGRLENSHKERARVLIPCSFVIRESTGPCSR